MNFLITVGSFLNMLKNLIGSDNFSLERTSTKCISYDLLKIANKGVYLYEPVSRQYRTICIRDLYVINC